MIAPIFPPLPENLGENWQRRARDIERRRRPRYEKYGWTKKVSPDGVSYWVPAAASSGRGDVKIPPLKLDLAPTINALLDPATLDIARTLSGNENSGLGFPFLDILQPITGLATAFVTSKSNEKIAKQEAKIEKLQIKGQNEQAQREFALLQAMKQVEPEEKARNGQVLALYAIGGVAALISTYMLVSMARSRTK